MTSFAPVFLPHRYFTRTSRFDSFDIGNENGIGTFVQNAVYHFIVVGGVNVFCLLSLQPFYGFSCTFMCIACIYVYGYGYGYGVYMSVCVCVLNEHMAIV